MVTGSKVSRQEPESMANLMDRHDSSSGVIEPGQVIELLERTEGARIGSLISLPLMGAAKATVQSLVVAFPPAPMALAASACVHLQ